MAKQAPKSNLHPRNLHRGRYDFPDLIKSHEGLKPFVAKNKFGDLSIDFFNPDAVKSLNQALLKKYYNIEFWDIPKGYLIPPIPGRSDYIHYIADLLAESNRGEIPKGKNVTCLDIGTGANCIYPILGNALYGWQFKGSEIDQRSVDTANKIIEANSHLKGQIDIRFQPTKADVFFRVMSREEKIDAVFCNPPFHSNPNEAKAAAARKVSNLKGQKVKNAKANFGGTHNELWTEGGEKRFVRNMIRQSKKFEKYCFWFTTLVSKKENLNTFQNALKKEGAVEVKVIEMGQGQKVSRVLAWTFLSKAEQVEWRVSRWNY